MQEKEKKNMESKGKVLFVGHGSPMNAIGHNRAREGWQKIAGTFEKPDAIVALSAHWATHGRYVLNTKTNKQIYDMYGFPKELYQVRYAPDSDTAVQNKVLEALDGMAQPSDRWGIDHGVWTVLSNMYPKADIPVVIVSTDVDASMEKHFEVGKRLAALRQENILLFFSGNVVHNLRLVNFEMEDGYGWADQFDRTMKEAVLSHHSEIAIDYEKVPDADLAVPTVEHYAPFVSALGAARKADRVTVFNDYRELGSMSMTGYLFQDEEK
jgi:4,5-DOPA dioxygenase extradiol